MNDNDIKTVTLTINSEQAQRKLDDINRRLEQARIKRQDAFDRGDGKALQAYAKEIKSLETQATRLSSRAQTVEKVLRSLDSATPKELKATIKEMNRELNSGNVERGSEQWQALTRSLQAANGELQKIKKEQKAASSADFLTNIGDKWQGVAVVFDSIAGKFSALKQAMAEYVNEYADMAEHMSGVKKYTGLTDEAVQQLNDDFMKMDTRTAREQLNDLAGDAGRLGIQSKQQILDFVQAADQINVALGEDLGEDAVKNIGKLAQLFGDADKMGLKQAMLSSASVINELAQSSSASEAYLMDFTARLAGVGKQAGMTQAQVMAFGSVLDQNMVNVEKGATALQNVITALYAKPAMMAKVAGLNVKEFTQLLKTDGNAALLQFVDALRKAGKMDALAPMLTDMKLSGAGVTQTLSTLAANIDTLKQTQQQATQAFAQGSSVTKEFNTANNTAQAQLEKAQKKAHDMAVQLGQQLYPAYMHVVNAGNSFLLFLTKVLPFIASHAKQILVVTAVIVAYTAAIKAQTIQTALAAAAQKAFNATIAAGQAIIGIVKGLGLALSLMYYNMTGNIVKARAAQMALNRTLISNPYAAVAAAVIAVAAAVYLWCTREKQLTQAQKDHIAIKKDGLQLEQKANEATAATQSRIYTLTAIIHDNNRKLSDRYTAIKALQRIVPEYNAQIGASGRITRENTNAIKDYIAELKKKTLLEAAQDKVKELMAAKINHETRLRKMKNAVSIRAQRLRDFEKEHADFAKIYNSVERQVGQGVYGAATTLASLSLTSEGREYATLKKLYAEAQGWVDEVNGDITTTDSRLNSIIRTVKNMGGSIDEILNLGTVTTPTTPTTEGTGYSGSGHDDTDAERRKKIRKQTAALDEQQRQEQATLLARYAARDIKTYYEYQQLKLQSDKKFLEKKRDLYKAGDSEINSLNEQIANTAKQIDASRTDWSLHQIDVETEERTQALNLRHEKEQMSEEQYQRELNAIQIQALTRRLNYLRDPKNKATAEQIHEAEEALDKKKKQAAYDEDLRFLQKVNQMRQEYELKSAEERKADELAFLEEVYRHHQGLLSEEEYQKAKKAIEDKYKKKEKDGKDGDDDKKDKPKDLGQPTDEMSQGVINLAQNLSNLSQKLKDGKAQWQDYAAVGIAAMSMIMATMSQASQLFQAQSQLEQAEVTKKYDAQIKAAGKNTKRTKKLEEQKQAELAKIKSKYNRKQMKVELAQAVAQTAMNAIMAYGSVVRIPFVGPIMAPIAAAAAVAAGAIQIAAITKQHQAEAEGYYLGGFTGGRQYRRQAGIVHEGEFVANHQAVNNPHLMPVLQLIDHAQRTNTVARLTADDVSRAITAPQTTANLAGQAITTAATAANNAPTVQVVDTATPAQTEAINQLNQQLAKGIKAYVVMSGPDGLDQQYTHYKKLTNP
ncbi:phage tail tape measure protein [Prevotellamassilia timonensis]|uniref:phage tail tape measure protein n=1 Tax=Prevotellamassilia timonensis TaxID=1852370 RepID=UPI003078BD6C